MKKVNEKLTYLCGGKMEDLYWSEEEQEEYEKVVFKDVAFHKGIEKVAKSMLKEEL